MKFKAIITEIPTVEIPVEEINSTVEIPVEVPIIEDEVCEEEWKVVDDKFIKVKSNYVKEIDFLTPDIHVENTIDNYTAKSTVDHSLFVQALPIVKANYKQWLKLKRSNSEVSYEDYEKALAILISSKCTLHWHSDINEYAVSNSIVEFNDVIDEAIEVLTSTPVDEVEQNLYQLRNNYWKS